MKNKLALLFLMFAVLMVFQGCSMQKEDVSKTSKYNPIKITDDGKFKKGSDYIIYSLKEFILLLKERNISIIDIKGASKVFISDGGSVRFDDTIWDYSFLKQIDSQYDIDSLDKLIKKQTIEAVFVKTQYEIFVFRQSLASTEKVSSIESFSSDVIITTNRDFVTEKGVKIGDSFETACKKYNLSAESIIKISDSDWCVWASDSGIVFIGSKDAGISSIELLNRCEVSLFHLNDVIEDFFA